MWPGTCKKNQTGHRSLDSGSGVPLYFLFSSVDFVPVHTASPTLCWWIPVSIFCSGHHSWVPKVSEVSILCLRSLFERIIDLSSQHVHTELSLSSAPENLLLFCQWDWRVSTPAFSSAPFLKSSFVFFSLILQMMGWWFRNLAWSSNPPLFTTSSKFPVALV